MSCRLTEVTEFLDQTWPKEWAADWDNPGLLCGGWQGSVTRVHFAVDATLAVIEEAIQQQAQLLITHHPLIFRPLSKVLVGDPIGEALIRLIKADCALYALHTNADADGVATVLAEALGMTELMPLVPVDESRGIGKQGKFSQPLRLGELLANLQAILPPTVGGIRAFGDAGKRLETAALCPGAGDSFLSLPAVLSADVYISADLRHHPALSFKEAAALSENQPALVDLSHWASEWLWLQEGKRRLQQRFPELTITVSTRCTDPWEFRI